MIIFKRILDLQSESQRKSIFLWRDRYGHEVDFIIGDEVCIEVKTSENITIKQLKNNKMLWSDEF
jgi:hypothetical protein